MKRHLLVIFALSAAISAAPSNTNCIVGCKCNDDTNLERTIRKITYCESPLTLTNQTFAKHSKAVNTLYFEHVTFTKIDKDALAGFNDLELIMIKDSKIESVDPTVFYLPDLGTVSFTNTTFAEVPNFISDYLETLIFYNCKLTTVPNLDQLPSLSILNLANNQINEISESAFVQLVNLEELDLSNNNISELPPNIFNNNSELNSLTLDYNPIESFRLSNSTNLEYLTLRSCKLTTFDASTSKNLDIVSHLDLSDNDISVLPIDAFAGMNDLIYINISNNKLVELSDDIFEDNRKLQKIILDGNTFTSLPKFQTDDDIFQTYYFSCKNCGLKSITDAFNNLPAIITLILANNQLDNVDGVFDKIKSLKELDLSNNSIEKIGAAAFSETKALETLNLSGNPITPLDPVVFTSMTYLKKLDISNTGLSQLWTNHNANLPSLERLFVSRNNLSKITVQDLKVTPNLKLIDLESNKLDCTQDLHDALVWLITNSVYPIQGIDKIKTHEALIASDAISFDDMDQQTSWKKVAKDICLDKITLDDVEELEDSDSDSEDTEADGDIDSPNTEQVHQYKTDVAPNNQDDFDYDDYYYDLEEYEEDKKFPWTTIDIDKKDPLDDNILSEESIMDHRNINLRASYILSVTSVFVFTALVVLTVVVAVTLLVLRRNRAFNMQNGNLPRLKIPPLWHSGIAQKKHSGSVYKSLSEDLSGPRTPMINRYEFKTTPTVHNTIP